MAVHILQLKGRRSNGATVIYVKIVETVIDFVLFYLSCFSLKIN
jgi:hypothetical protein